MKINELEGVIKRIRYYDVGKAIGNVSTYLNNLTEKEVYNILSMRYPNNIRLCPTGETFDFATVFNNHKLLSSSEFKEILDLLLENFIGMAELSKCPNKEVRKKIFEIINFRSFYSILNHDNVWEFSEFSNVKSDIEIILQKLELIIKEQKDNNFSESKLLNDQLLVIILMQDLSKAKWSRKKASHATAMEELKSTNDPNKADAISLIQCSEKIMDAATCYKYFDYINQAKSKLVVGFIKALAFTDLICDEEIKMILEANTDENAGVLFNVAQSVLNSENYDKYKDTYLDDMHLITKTEDIEIAKALGEVALSLDSISKGKKIHNVHMQTIYNSNDSYKAKTYANVILDKKDRYDEFDEILYNARRFVDSCGDDKELPAHVFSLRKKDDK